MAARYLKRRGEELGLDSLSQGSAIEIGRAINTERNGEGMQNNVRLDIIQGATSFTAAKSGATTFKGTQNTMDLNQARGKKNIPSHGHRDNDNICEKSKSTRTADEKKFIFLGSAASVVIFLY